MELRLLTDAAYAEELDIVADELVDQYVSEQLSAQERRQLERYFFQSGEGGDKLRFALALKKHASELSGRDRPRWKVWRPYLSVAASILIVAGLAFGVWRGFFYHSDVDKGLTALRAAYTGQRPVEARVSGFGYAPASRGEEGVDSLQRDRAISLLTGAVAERPGAASHHALGQYYIAARRFDEAIAQLEAALGRDPQNAKAHSDLGVALLERGKEAQQNNDPGPGLQYIARGLEHVRKALELDGSLPEARFNLALLLQRMGLHQPAEEAWRKYLEIDRDSGWADEARANLRALEERRQKAGAQSGARALQDFLEAYRGRDDEAAWRVLSRNREAIAGRFIPSRLANAYIESAAGGRARDAAEALGALGYAGELEERRAGDLYTAGIARFYRSTRAGRLAALADAHESVNVGYEHCQRSGFADAAAAFDEARRTFASAGNEAEAAFADYWRAYSYYHSNQNEESRSVTRALILNCKEKGYKWLLAQALNLLSNIRAGDHEHSAVLALTGEALSLSEQVNDAYGMQKHLASLAGKYGTLHNFPESLDHLARCLLLADDFWPGTRQAWRNYDTAAQVFDFMGLYSASAAYGEEALRLALEGSKDPSLIYLSHVRLGMAYGRLQNYSEGVRHARTGLSIGGSLPDRAAGQKIVAYSALQLGELHRLRGDLEEAARSYDRAVEIYDRLSFQAFSFVAHRGRFLTYLAAGDDARAGQELGVVLGLFEEYRAKLKEEENRVYFFDTAQEVYDAAIDFTHSKVGDKEAAFAHSENSRARSLLATMHGYAPGGAPERSRDALSPVEIRRRMPEQVQLLQYSVLADKVLIWVVSRSGLQVRESAVSHDTLNGLARDYLGLVTRPSSDEKEVRVASARLYDALVAPVEDLLDAGRTLCVVPDKILNHLPFAALASPQSGRYLVQDYPLLFSPSASVFVTSTEAALRMRAPAGEKLLSVGNPSFDRVKFASLPDLPTAEAEASAVARKYGPPPPLVLTGRDARKQLVVGAMKDSDVIHLASHYIVDERYPLRSQLLLAKTPERDDPLAPSDGAILAGDIYNMRLYRPRLAVLSACRTGVERYHNGEGMIGMARTFLGAGVPLVVASQWPVDTVSTAGLMESFHGRRRHGGGLQTVEALRAAQTDSIDGPSQRHRHPYYWAAFVAVGGYAAF